MTETQTLRDPGMRPVRTQAPTAGHPGHPVRPVPRGPVRRPGRLTARLRGLLQAQALLNGSAGGPYDAAFVEDDRRRLSGRQAR